jgi:rhamnulokinase
MKYYLAIDIGASSGRHIVGRQENGEIKTDEVFRFQTGFTEENGHLVNDVKTLRENVLNGIRAAFEKYPKIGSIAIDTWGVDYVLLRGEEEVLPVYAYRDKRTEEAIGEVHRRVPFEKLYERTGIQFQPFNTVYQLYADKQAGRLDGVTDFLMLPEYLSYCLTGMKSHEYTNATTTGLVNAKSGQYDTEIVKNLSLPVGLFKKLSAPRTVIGRLKEEVKAYVGGDATVVLCASHDTASAVEGIPMPDQLYISSGTWSLLGVKSPVPLTDEKSRKANYSNEGGVGYIRYQKNIMGMWVVNNLRKELCPDKPFGEIVAGAERSKFLQTADINADSFLAPESMKEAFEKALGRKDLSTDDYFNCAFRSLALSYKTAIEELEQNTGRRYNELYIVGGGAKNKYLNRLTEEFTGKKVIGLPIEATAIGNLKIQTEAEYE